MNTFTKGQEVTTTAVKELEGKVLVVKTFLPKAGGYQVWDGKMSWSIRAEDLQALEVAVEEFFVSEVATVVEEVTTVEGVATKASLIEGLGFVNVTESTLVALAGKTTKSAQAVLTRIKESDVYEVYTNGANVTIDSEYVVTKQEKQLISKLLGCEFITVGTIMDNNNMWSQWIKAV